MCTLCWCVEVVWVCGCEECGGVGGAPPRERPKRKICVGSHTSRRLRTSSSAASASSISPCFHSPPVCVCVCVCGMLCCDVLASDIRGDPFHTTKRVFQCVPVCSSFFQDDPPHHMTHAPFLTHRRNAPLHSPTRSTLLSLACDMRDPGGYVVCVGEGVGGTVIEKGRHARRHDT